MKIKPHINQEKFKNYRENEKNNKQFQEYTKDNTPEYKSRKITRLTSFCYCHDKNLEELLAETETEKILELIKIFEDYKNQHDYSPEGIKTEIKTIRGIYRFIGIDLPRKNSPINLDYTNDIKKSNSYKKFKKQKNRAESTLRRYTISLTQYCNYHQKRIDELIEEADKEEEKGIRENKRKIKDRILDYRNYLRENKYSPKTITSRINNIKTFYRANSITIPYIEPDTNQHERQLRYDEIPTKQHIKRALETTSNIKNRAIILFMATSGSASNETVDITIKQYMEGTKEHHNETTDIERALKKMDGNTVFIPIIPMTRGKNQFEYYTAITPEANQYIINYLKTRKNLTLEDKLFDTNSDQIKYMFATINDKNKWGWVKDGIQRFFTSHQLRRYHFNAIKDTRFAHTIEGRKFSKTEEAYFTRNPEDIREEYKQYLEKLTIYEKYQVHTVTDENYKKLKEENQKLKEDMKKQEKVWAKKLEAEIEKSNKEFIEKFEELSKELKHTERTTPIDVEIKQSIDIHMLNLKDPQRYKDKEMTKFEKQIMELDPLETLTVKETAYEMAINDQLFEPDKEGIEKVMKKAIVKMKAKPELKLKVKMYLEEQNKSTEKMELISQILNEKLNELNMWEDEELEELKNNILAVSLENIDNILMEDINQDFIMELIENQM